MGNDRYDQISYEDGWRNVSQPEYYTYVPTNLPAVQNNKGKEKHDFEDIDGDETNKTRAKKITANKPWLIIIQLILCIILFIAALILKEINTDFFNTLKSWYTAELNNSLIITDGFNLKNPFVLQATPDEK